MGIIISSVSLGICLGIKEIFPNMSEGTYMILVLLVFSVNQLFVIND